MKYRLDTVPGAFVCVRLFFSLYVGFIGYLVLTLTWCMVGLALDIDTYLPIVSSVGAFVVGMVAYVRKLWRRRTLVRDTAVETSQRAL